MLSGWNKTRSRIAGLTWDELRVRSTQSVRKRMEFARHLAGLPAKLTPLDLSRPARGTFFFSCEDLPSIAAALRESLPLEVDEILRDADAICRHRFRLLGYDNLDYGDEIDWHFDAVHGKRAPALPWFNVPYLDFSSVGDHKVIWELNRHQHLVTLAKAWVLTGNEKYVTELIRQWYSWRSANPFPIGINWASSLEVAFRSLSWLWVRSLLAGCVSATSDFDQDLVQALGLNGRYIEHYLSTYFSPNTHLLGEAVALFFIGTLCPQLEPSQRWQTSGLRIVLQQAGRQVRTDGFYFEQSLYYHVYALDFLLHFRLLAQRNNVEIPKNFDSTVNRMLDALRTLVQAGTAESFGDDDGGRVFDPARNRAEHLTDPLALGFLLTGRDEVKQSASLSEEAIWLFGAKAASVLDRRLHRASLKAAALESAGIYLLACSEPHREQLVVDAGTMGMGRGGHGHTDALNVTVSLDGRRWLVDAGTYSYSEVGRQRDRFRGTAAHNTLLVDDLDQAISDGPFAWQAPPQGRVEQWIPGSIFSLFSGRHNGYERLTDPVLHRRFVFHLHGSFWLIRDVIEGKAQHDLQLSWHFHPDVFIHEGEKAIVAHTREEVSTGSTCMALIFPESEEWAHFICPDEISPAYGAKQAAQVVNVTARVCLPTETATLIVPLRLSAEAPGKLSKRSALNGKETCTATAYLYQTGEAQHWMIFSQKQEPWLCETWESDAEFLYCAMQNKDLVHLIICNGSFATLGGESVFQHSQRIARYEGGKQERENSYVLL